jgi:hypothetical protein
MNGTLHWYVFRFSRNHHQAIRSNNKKKLQISPVLEVFAQFFSEVSLIFLIRPSTVTGQLISFTSYSKHFTSHQFTCFIFQYLTSLKLTFTRRITGHYLRKCTTIKCSSRFEKYCPSSRFSPLSPHPPQISTVSSHVILQEKRNMYILTLICIILDM